MGHGASLERLAGVAPRVRRTLEVQDARRRALAERIVAVALIGLVVLTRAAAVGWLVARDPCRLPAEVHDLDSGVAASRLGRCRTRALVGWRDVTSVGAARDAREDSPATRLLDPAHRGAGRD